MLDVFRLTFPITIEGQILKIETLLYGREWVQDSITKLKPIVITLRDQLNNR